MFRPRNSRRPRRRRSRYRRPTIGAPSRMLAYQKPATGAHSTVITSSYSGIWTLGSPQQAFGGRYLIPLTKFYITLSNFANYSCWASTWDHFRIEHVTASFTMNPQSTTGGKLLVAVDPDGGGVPSTPNVILSYRRCYTADLHPSIRPSARFACTPGILTGNILQGGMVDTSAGSTAQFNCFQTGWWDTQSAVTDIILYAVITARIRFTGAK